MNKLVLYPGAFDPFHAGHLAVAQAASARLSAHDQLWICPEPSPRAKTGIKPLSVRESIISASLTAVEDPRIRLGRLDTTAEGNFRLDSSFAPLTGHFDQIIVILGADKYPRVQDKWPGVEQAREQGLSFGVASRGNHPVNLLHKEDQSIGVESTISSQIVKQALVAQKPIKTLVLEAAQAQIEDFYP